MTTTLILVRHGEIPGNKHGYVGGSTDEPLNDTGREQAARVAAHLKDTEPDIAAIYASPLLRAWHTAGAIAQAIDIEPQPEPDLVEWDAGDWEGMTYPQVFLQKDFKPERLIDPAFRPPNGEALGEVQTRVVDVFQRLAAHHTGQRIILVSHGSALALALAHLLDPDMTTWMNYQKQNCAITEITLGDEAELIKFNEGAHLE